MTNDNKIRNLKGFITSYLDSKAGQSALQRRPFHVQGKGQVWQSAAMATAFQTALGA
jgi:hypothetical protein